LAGFIHKDQNRFISSFKYFQKACNASLPEACPFMKDVEANINSFTKDIGNAEEICKNSQPVCIRLGVAYYYLEQFKNAEKILLEGCKSGQKLGCYLLGQYYSYVQQTTKAGFFYSKACLLKYELACELEASLKKSKQ
jgi:TPR repeat protein